MSTSPFPLKPQQARTGQLKKQWKANPISQKQVDLEKKNEKLRVYRNREIRNQLRGVIKEEQQKAGNEAAEIRGGTELVIKGADNNHNRRSSIHKIEMGNCWPESQPMASPSSVA